MFLSFLTKYNDRQKPILTLILGELDFNSSKININSFQNSKESNILLENSKEVRVAMIGNVDSGKVNNFTFVLYFYNIVYSCRSSYKMCTG